jgi:DNA-binding MarR family transcriptional regulator
MGEIAAGTLLLGPSVSRIVANLTGLGLVRRRPAAHDQRRMMVRLSAAGRRLAGRVAPLVEQAYADIEHRFGADRLAKLLAMMDELVEASSPGASFPDARPADVGAREAS